MKSSFKSVLHCMEHDSAFRRLLRSDSQTLKQMGYTMLSLWVTIENMEETDQQQDNNYYTTLKQSL